MKNNSTIWKFFASVKLALFTLGFLAISSIIGTLIPQGEEKAVYIQKFGAKTAQFFELFDFNDMYSAWWFVTLLGLLCANLIICTIDRFPAVWKIIKRDNLDIPLQRILKTGTSHSFSLPLALPDALKALSQNLNAKGWKNNQREIEDAQVIFSQKTPLARTGVYIVHVSILVIFAGAVYGKMTGFRGGIMLPEQQSSSIVYPYDKSPPIQLDFEVRCERFDIDFHANGAPKLFRSLLTIIENGKTILQKPIEVNIPLTYKGVTFYQSSYQGFRDFVFSIRAEEQPVTYFTGQFQKEVKWPEHNLSFGIINLESFRDRVTRIKIWLSDGKNEPQEFWMKAADEIPVNISGKTYQFSAKQMYATGLQVAKDPGVWIVYIGCALMLIGLYMAFFMSHQRIWLVLKTVGAETTIEMRGTTNKNKVGFAKKYDELALFLQEKTQ